MVCADVVAGVVALVGVVVVAVVVAVVTVVAAVVVAVVVAVVAVVVESVPVVVAPKGRPDAAARAVSTPRAATTTPSRRSQIARRIAKL
jgi:hypothetical protein